MVAVAVLVTSVIMMSSILAPFVKLSMNISNQIADYF